MHYRYEEHYREMKLRLAVCSREMSDPLWTYLKATAIAKQYRGRLPLPRLHLTLVGYFKDHLPWFEAEVQYQELRYEAERSRPAEADPTWAAFWLQEVSRMTQLTEAHPGLYAYFREGRTDRDLDYFGGDPAQAEQHSLLWASFIALARYEQDLETIFIELLNT